MTTTHEIPPSEILEEVRRREPLLFEVCAQAVLIRRLMKEDEDVDGQPEPTDRSPS